MTLNELALTLPNGFHDAEVSTLTIHYARRELVLNLSVWVGDLHSPDPEIYRSAIVTLSGLLFCVIEPPDPRYPYRDGQTLIIDTGTVESLTHPPTTQLPDEPLEGSFTNWIYVREWNSFLYVRAIEASLGWLD